MHTLRFAQRRLKGNGGASPQLSRSCEFLYDPRAIMSTASAIHRRSGKAPGGGTKSEDLPNSRNGGKSRSSSEQGSMRHHHHFMNKQGAAHAPRASLAAAITAVRHRHLPQTGDVCALLYKLLRGLPGREAGQPAFCRASFHWPGGTTLPARQVLIAWQAA